MTPIVKSISVPQTPTVVGGRMASGMRNVATVDGSNVDELYSGVGASFDNATFLAPRYDRRGLGDQPAERRLGGDTSRFTTPSQSFAALLESSDGQTLNSPGANTSGGQSKFSGFLAQAISIYETNAKVISGTLELPGATVNVSF